MGTRESEITEAIRIAVMSEQTCVLHRVNSGVAMTKGGHYVRFGFGDGSPDLVGWLVGSGRLFAIEVKTATGSLRPNQRAWIRWANETGAYACVARSAEEACHHLSLAISGARGPELSSPGRKGPRSR
jgi:hypothetical protein